MDHQQVMAENEKNVKSDAPAIDTSMGGDQASRARDALDALQQQVSAADQTSPTDFIKSLPQPVQRRIKNLKRLQSEIFHCETNFYKKVHELERQFADEYAKLYRKRSEVVSGDVEPTDEECIWPSDDDESDDELSDSVTHKLIVNDSNHSKATPDDDGKSTKGIPDFWLTIFKNVDMLSEMIQDYDEPVLRHLMDITAEFLPDNKHGFILKFHFSPNDYFINPVLTKEYSMRFEPDPEDVLSYEGPEIIGCRGCTIDWRTGKNLTIKTVKKVQRHKGQGSTRTVTKQVKRESFFNFFNPPSVIEGEPLNEDVEDQLSSDYEVGHFIHDRIIPKAVLYFTGEALDDDDDDDLDDDDDDDDDDGDGYEEDDEDN